MTGVAVPVAITHAPSAASDTKRVQSIDGLRGIAALLVVLFHLHIAVSRAAADWLWPPIDWIARHGSLGVDIFFVISGFVIALSVSRGAGTFAYFGRFILRRSIRLDPPYWAAILLEILLLHLTLRVFPEHQVVLPSAAQIISHVLYLQNLLGYGNIVIIFWTLCYEIQFYAFFAGLVVVRQYVPHPFRTMPWVHVVAGGFFVLSLWIRFIRPGAAPNGLFIDHWYQFFIGTLTYFAVCERGRMGTLRLAWGTLVGAVLYSSASPLQLLPIIVSAWLVASSRNERWSRLLSNPSLQFLGGISYSLYLYHSSVGWRFVSLMQWLIPGTWTPILAVGVFLTGTVVSILFAALMWRLIERPSLKASQKIRMPMRIGHARIPATFPIPALAQSVFYPSERVVRPAVSALKPPVLDSVAKPRA
jgi:peptidoglycan/LPS O-acetylase OafA/YrhL